jgi:hypothetical protein
VHKQTLRPGRRDHCDRTRLSLHTDPRERFTKEQSPLLRIVVVFTNDESTDLQCVISLGNLYGMEFADDYPAVLQDQGWWYRKYAPKNKELARAEAAARKAKRGLWADAKPIPPWDWRQSERERKSRSDVDSDYWLNTSTGVRHNRSCRNYRNTKRGRPCGADEGKACGMCGG